MNEPPSPGHPPPPGAGGKYEPADVAALPILAFLAILAFALLLFSGGIWLWMAASNRRAARLDHPLTALAEKPLVINPAPPRLRLDPKGELRDFLQRETEKLNSYGWVDSDTGTVRIPIRRAMEMMVNNPAEKDKLP